MKTKGPHRVLLYSGAHQEPNTPHNPEAIIEQETLTYCANGLNVSNLIGNYLVNFMYSVMNSFDKYLNRIGNLIAFIER